MAKQTFSFSTMHLSDIPKFIVALVKGEAKGSEEMMTGQTGKYEINLVPDVKYKMIQMQKIRNMVMFICIVVASASIAVTLILGSVKGAQDLTMKGQDDSINQLSSKIANYNELSSFLTIQDQLQKISEIEGEQKVLSRIFPIFTTMVPTGDPTKTDSIQVSELNIDLNASTIAFDAIADARVEPLIDYRVLEAFKKTVSMMKYDYGRYVDADGNEIPTRCIDETDANGNAYNDSGSIYVIWKRGELGCDPSRDDYATNTEEEVVLDDEDEEEEDENQEEEGTEKKKLKEDNTNSSTTVITLNPSTSSTLQNTEFTQGNSNFGVINVETKVKDDNKSVKITVVADEKIYRTPQFADWHKGKKIDTSKDGIGDELPEIDGTQYVAKKYTYTPSMDLDGTISGVPHFESQCYTYSGIEDGKDVKWSANNDCLLVPEGLLVSSSGNGRDAENNLVLAFSASLTFDPNIFAYNNKHVMAISPTKQNVTDSYRQTQSLFTAPAVECSADDEQCASAKNDGGEE
jgi:hypothetical protein